MIIEIHQPEIEALIEQRMATGAFESIEDLLLRSLEASPSPKAQQGEAAAPAPKPSLSQFLMESPLWKSGLVVERSKDVPFLDPAEPDTAQRTGRDLIDAMQSMPHRDIDIEPARPHMPVRDVAF